MNRIARYYYVCQALGWDNLPRRIWQTIRRKLGVLKRQLPGRELSASEFTRQFVPDYEPQQAPQRWHQRAERFFASPSRRSEICKTLRARIDDEPGAKRLRQGVAELASGIIPFFSGRSADLGRPPNFHRDPLHGVEWPRGRHWTQYDQFDPNLADMKCVWEASRFSWAFLLARQHVRESCGAAVVRDRNALRSTTAADELFWSWLHEWDRQNPYGMTVQWACGQEASFRLFAWLFAAIVMLDSPHATPKRLARLSELVWYTGRHIDYNINYARGQKNNHAISEAAALWTIGLLFPEMRAAARWREKGRRILAAETARQIYDDGSYVQHSINYHRLMMDDLLWALRLGDVCGDPLPEVVRDRFRRAHQWLLPMIHPATGAAPNYGANDGALILPFTSCDYADFRPVAQAAEWLLHRRRAFEPGPWDESVLWLFDDAAAALLTNAESKPQTRGAAALRDTAYDDGGYYLLRGSCSSALIRCHTYRDRPGQADMLHFDATLDGINVLRDAGSYHYYCAAAWQHYFLSTAAHNTVEIDEQDQMIKGPRFLWMRWTRSRLIQFAPGANGRVSYFAGEHYGYTRLPGRVVHRRDVLRIDDHYIVLDEIAGHGRHRAALRWRLAPLDWQPAATGWTSHIGDRQVRFAVAGPASFALSFLSGQTTPRPAGWESRYYTVREPVPTVVLAGEIDLPARFVTIFSPQGGPRLAPSAQDCGPALPIRVLDAPDASRAAIESLSSGRFIAP